MKWVRKRHIYWFPSQTLTWMRWREGRWKLRWIRRVKRCRRPTVEYVAHTHTHTDADTNIHTKHTLRAGTQTCSSPIHNNEFRLMRKNYTAAACSMHSAFRWNLSFSVFTQSLMQRTFPATFLIFPSRSAQKQSALFVCEFPDWRMPFSSALFAQINDVRWYSRLPTLFDVTRCNVRWICVMIIFTYFLVFFGILSFFFCLIGLGCENVGAGRPWLR